MELSPRAAGLAFGFVFQRNILQIPLWLLTIDHLYFRQGHITGNYHLKLHGLRFLNKVDTPLPPPFVNTSKMRPLLLKDDALRGCLHCFMVQRHGLLLKTKPNNKRKQKWDFCAGRWEFIYWIILEVIQLEFNDVGRVVNLTNAGLMFVKELLKTVDVILTEFIIVYEDN